ncbi:MAG: IS5 family transposase [Planctomycetota bacterium]
MSRHDLTDVEWKAIRFHLPREKNGKRGRPWNDHRTVINGILFVICTGIAWRDLPSCYGKWQTVYNRFRRWTVDGLWRRIWHRLVRRLDSNLLIGRQLWCIDGSVIRAHRCAAGGSLKTPRSSEENGLGRSRGGFSSKLHLACDEFGTIIGMKVTAGQRGEAPEFLPVIESIPLSLHRWKNRPCAIAGDKGYSSHEIRNWISEKGIQCIIPTRSNESSRPGFSRSIYRQRNVVERVIGRLKEFRRIATRYDKTIESFSSVIMLATLRITLKSI